MNKSLVANLRKQKGLTQESLAEKAHVTVRTIQRIEAGEDVSNETLKSVSNALSVTISELFEFVESKEKEVELMDISKEQQKQINYRNNEINVYRVLAIGITFLMLGCLSVFIDRSSGSLHKMYYVMWISLLLISIGLIRYLLNIHLSQKLDIKYPMSVGIEKRRSYNREPVKNKWDFMARYWWIIFPIGGFLSWLIPEIMGR